MTESNLDAGLFPATHSGNALAPPKTSGSLISRGLNVLAPSAEPVEWWVDGHTAFVTACAFSPYGRRLATASGDHTARLWNVTTGQEARRFDGRRR